jgi:hypothetical protein
LSSIKIADKDKIFTKHPWVGRTLEIGCRDAQRIKIGRDRGHNLWGLEERDFSPSWKLMGIDHYVKRGKPTRIPYPDQVFDFVMTPDALKPPESISTLTYTSAWYELVFKEIHRVGRKDFFLKLPDWINMKSWMHHLTEAGFNVTMMQKSMQGNFLVEANRYV